MQFLLCAATIFSYDSLQLWVQGCWSPKGCALEVWGAWHPQRWEAGSLVYVVHHLLMQRPQISRFS